MTPRCYTIRFIAVTCIAFTATAAQAADFRANIAGETRQASTEPVEINGIKYMPVDAFCAAFGGTCESIASQMRAKFGEHSAILVHKEAEVHSTLGSFFLTQPILGESGLTYVAEADLEPFFAKGFGITLEKGPALAPLNPDALEPAMPPEEPAAETAPEPGSETAPAAPGSMKSAVIIVDAGHGGRDVGYTADNGVSEKDLTLKLSERVLNALKEKTPARIYGTRREDKDLSTRDRARLANENGGTLFISLHAGVSRAPKASGIDLYITDTPLAGQSRTLGATPGQDAAQSVQSSRAIAQALQTQFEKSGMTVRSVRQAPIRVLNEVTMPGVLVEIGYLSNAAESELLAQEAYLDQLAGAILAGIYEAVTGEAPPS